MEITAYTAEFVKVGLAYVALIFVFPLMMWKNYLRDKNYRFRFMFCALTQPFLLTNLVLFLALLKVCNRVTLIGSLFAIFVTIRFWGRRKQVIRSGINFGVDIKKIILREYGIKLFLYRKIRFLKMFVKTPASHMIRHVRTHFLEYILMIAALGYNLWYFSYGVLHINTGFGDFAVHARWIYDLANGELFSDGIYPFAMHCMVYLLHSVFLFDITDVLLYFGIFQTMLTVLMLYCLMRMLCKGKYIPYIAMICFAMLGGIKPNIMNRMQRSLPQETVVYTLYACAIFLMNFLNQKREAGKKKAGRFLTSRKAFFEKKNWSEQREKRKLLFNGNDKRNRIKKWKEKLSEISLQGLKNCCILPWKQRFKRWGNFLFQDINLVLFSISVALTLMTHFYITIFAFFVCAAIGIVYMFRFFRKQYFLPIMAAALIGAFVAVLPFGVAFAQGIEFNYSMRWATNVIKGAFEEDVTPETETSQNQEESSSPSEGEGEEPEHPEDNSVGITQKIGNLLSGMREEYVTKIFEEPVWYEIFLIACGIAAAASLFYLIRGDISAYGGWMFSILYEVFLAVLFCADNFGIPNLVEANRVPAFIMCNFYIILALPFDIIFQLLSGVKKNWMPYANAALSFSIFLGITGGVIQTGQVRELPGIELAQYNQASDCVKQIKRQFADHTWTIISPVDELYMILGQGYHTELIDFLHAVEYEEKALYIPTPYVFLFVEKRVMKYGQYINLGDINYQYTDINLKDARKNFTIEKNASNTYKVKREIIFSKAYYWAKKFQEMYPNEMSVFYEDETYVCYMFEQNPYFLYNLNFDYLLK